MRFHVGHSVVVVCFSRVDIDEFAPRTKKLIADSDFSWFLLSRKPCLVDGWPFPAEILTDWHLAHVLFTFRRTKPFVFVALFSVKIVRYSRTFVARFHSLIALKTSFSWKRFLFPWRWAHNLLKVTVENKLRRVSNTRTGSQESEKSLVSVFLITKIVHKIATRGVKQRRFN